MFRNNYDNDSVTLYVLSQVKCEGVAGLKLKKLTKRSSSSPQGRIFQVEYAQEAVKQGSVVVGIVSKKHAILAALKVLEDHSFLIHSRLNRTYS